MSDNFKVGDKVWYWSRSCHPILGDILSVDMELGVAWCCFGGKSEMCILPYLYQNDDEGKFTLVQDMRQYAENIIEQSKMIWKAEVIYEDF